VAAEICFAATLLRATEAVGKDETPWNSWVIDATIEWLIAVAII